MLLLLFIGAGSDSASSHHPVGRRIGGIVFRRDDEDALVALDIE